MNGIQEQQESQTKQLAYSEIPVKINLGRKTAYSLMWARFHSVNDLKQSISGKLWSAYVIPMVLYDFEVLDLKQSDINQLEQ